MFNKKGTTLVEVIISIALISIVLAFMIKLLIDINNTDTNNKYAKGNQIKRAEIIRTIENDIKDKVITQITNNTTDKTIEIKYNDNSSSKISLTDKTVKYTDTNNKTEKWTLDEGTIYTDNITINLNYNNSLGSDSIYALLIDIEIHTANENNTVGKNNTIDDILINYIGYNEITVIK